MSKIRALAKKLRSLQPRHRSALETIADSTRVEDEDLMVGALEYVFGRKPDTPAVPLALQLRFTALLETPVFWTEIDRRAARVMNLPITFEGGWKRKVGFVRKVPARVQSLLRDWQEDTADVTVRALLPLDDAAAVAVVVATRDRGYRTRALHALGDHPAAREIAAQLSADLANGNMDDISCSIELVRRPIRGSPQPQAVCGHRRGICAVLGNRDEVDLA